MEPAVLASPTHLLEMITTSCQLASLSDTVWRSELSSEDPRPIPSTPRPGYKLMKLEVEYSERMPGASCTLHRSSSTSRVLSRLNGKVNEACLGVFQGACLAKLTSRSGAHPSDEVQSQSKGCLRGLGFPSLVAFSWASRPPVRTRRSNRSAHGQLSYTRSQDCHTSDRWFGFPSCERTENGRVRCQYLSCKALCTAEFGAHIVLVYLTTWSEAIEQAVPESC